MRIFRSTLITLVATGISTIAAAQNFKVCTTDAGGVLQPKFGVVPSLVVHSDTIMDLQRSALGLPGDAGERVFSFKRTITNILSSAGSVSDLAAAEAFLQTMIGTFQPANEFALNAAAGVNMPFDFRPNEAQMVPAALLDETSPFGMKPLAVFNRFDLAPDNWAHCGEHRIIFGKELAATAPPGSPRFLMIFEASVPNPAPEKGADGCRPIAEFWAKLSDPQLSPTEIARRLSAFFYEGRTSPNLPKPDLLGPVISYQNLGGDGGRGQVRGNLFMEQRWQLREWLTQRTFSTSGSLAFVPTTVKANPLAELYRDNVSILTKGGGAIPNLKVAVDLLHGQFVQALTNSIGKGLLSETSDKHRNLVLSLPSFDLGSAAGSEVTADTVLLNTIGLNNDDKFNEFQSVSQGPEDVPGQPAAQSLTLRMLLDAFAALPNNDVPPQNAQILLNRATAASCGGCHMTAAKSQGFSGPGVPVLRRADNTELLWPDVAGAFVHVNETTRTLSPALREAFLPFRRYVLARFVCTPGDPEYQVSSVTAVAAPTRTGVAPALPAAVVRQLEIGSPFVTDLILEQASRDGPKTAAPDMTEQTSESLNETIAALPPDQRLALQRKVNDALFLAREIEMSRPGAFVETRRPH
ncbi:hypothetical protein ACI2KT_30670 [Ensifer adhaerens]|uniref:hypothetical protein n=1 Tax=Ensifer adhaerens TaxID=106592 RepID=UPI0038510D45